MTVFYLQDEMEPIIPVNVREEMLSDASSGELNLNGPSVENLCSTLSRDDAIILVGRLTAENQKLKGTLC